jgi:hypothetical protein
MKKILPLFILFIQIQNSCFANENDFLDSYYNNLFLGEKKTENYVGPTDPRARLDNQNGTLKLLDDKFKENYFNAQIQLETLDLENFWSQKIIEKSTCPDITLGENIEYIRYLYRLLSISYLFESIKLNHNLSSELNAGKNICSLSFDEIFGKCRPLTDDMKKFHERASAVFSNEISRITSNSFNKKEIVTWLDNFHHSTLLTIDPVKSRLQDWCLSEGENCKGLSLDEVKNALGNICKGDKELIQNICSEKDSLFGSSYVEKATELIEKSNAFNVINKSGMGEDCLRRYVKIFSPKEIRYNSLGRQFPLVYSHLVRKGSRYLQGELFLPGALKEFDIKGLSDFLVALKPPKVQPLVKILPKPKPKRVVIEKVVPKVVTPAIVPAPEVVAVAPPAKPELSEFEKSVLEFEEKSPDSITLDMDKFRDDFEFSQQMIADLANPIKKFQTRTALNDMKSYDNLGSREAPMGLIFLKYLIDTENHQGLYNITTVLGEKFFVNNDIEKKEKPVYIELKNDSSTKNQWQIFLIKKPISKSK